MHSIRIIGCGNLYRGDDAAGLLVVHRLREMGIEAQEAGDEMLRLMSVWQPEETVYLVDAALADVAPGTVLHYRPEQLRRAGSDVRFSTHGIDIAELVGLAGALGRLPRELNIIGIVGQSFDAGAKVCPAVRVSIDAVAADLASLVRRAEQGQADEVTQADQVNGAASGAGS